MRSYRLTIESTDLSQVILEDTSSGYAGFAVIKAARGSAEPLFIPRGNANYIAEQFGPARASNKHVQEIIDFNTEHDVWVSAPEGLELNGMENKKGAVFISKNGIYKGYISPGQEEDTSKTRLAYFDKKGSMDHVKVEDAGASYSSTYVEFKIASNNLHQIKMSNNSTFEVLIKDLDGVEHLLKSQASVYKWADRDTGDVTTQIPTDSDILNASSWEYLIDDLNTNHSAWFTDSDNLNNFYFLQAVDSTGTPTSVLNGFAYIVEELGILTLNVRFYLQKQMANPEATPVVNVFDYFDTIDPILLERITEEGGEDYFSLTSTATISAAAMFYQKFATETKTNIKFSRTPRKTASSDLIDIAITDWPSANVSISPRNYTVSFDREAVDDYKTSVALDNVITRDRVIGVSILGDEEVEATHISEILPLYKLYEGDFDSLAIDAKGFRCINHLSDEADIFNSLNIGWELSKGITYDQVVIFFSPEEFAGLDTVFTSCRSIHKFARFVMPACKGFTEANVPDIPDARNSYVNHHGLVYPINEIKTRDKSSGTSWWRFPVGALCKMLVRIMRQNNGAWAPMFINDRGNVGGQIDASYEDIRIKSVENQREIDETGFNMLVADPDLGLMMVNQRTGQNPNTINDASWLVHDMAFDLYKRAVYRTIMTPQLGKPINDDYIGIRTRQLEDLSGDFSNAFAETQNEVARLNTPESRAQRRFKLASSVKVTPFSEFVDFEFYNVGQTADVSDPFEDL